MLQDEAFLRAIVEAPDNDAPRLVYADWLDEHGAGARAEFIRLQCRLTRYCPEDEGPWPYGVGADRLAPARRDELLAPLLALGLEECTGRHRYGAESGFAFYFRRGFVEAVEVYGAAAAGQFIETAERLFAVTPLRYLRLVPERVGPMAPAFHFESFRRFDPIPLPTIRALVALPQMRRLRGLSLPGHYLRDECAEVLCSSPHLSPDLHLILSGNNLSATVQKALHQRFQHPCTFDGRHFLPEEEIPF